MYVALNEVAHGITAFRYSMSPLSNVFGASQDLIERIPRVIFSYELTSGSFTYLNPAFEQVFGITRESAADVSSLLAMVHPEDLSDLEEKYRQVISVDTPFPDPEEGLEGEAQVSESFGVRVIGEKGLSGALKQGLAKAGGGGLAGHGIGKRCYPVGHFIRAYK